MCCQTQLRPAPRKPSDHLGIGPVHFLNRSIHLRCLHRWQCNACALLTKGFWSCISSIRTFDVAELLPATAANRKPKLAALVMNALKSAFLVMNQDASAPATAPAGSIIRKYEGGNGDRFSVSRLVVQEANKHQSVFGSYFGIS